MHAASCVSAHACALPFRAAACNLPAGLTAGKSWVLLLHEQGRRGLLPMGWESLLASHLGSSHFLQLAALQHAVHVCPPALQGT